MLYEFVDVATNSVVSRLLVKTNKYSFSVQSAKVDRDWVALQVTGDRVITYSLASGKEVGHVFGHAPAISTVGGAYAVSAGEGEVNVYGLADSRLLRTSTTTFRRERGHCRHHLDFVLNSRSVPSTAANDTSSKAERAFNFRGAWPLRRSRCNCLAGQNYAAVEAYRRGLSSES